MNDATRLSCQRSLPPTARGKIDPLTGFMPGRMVGVAWAKRSPTR